MWRVFQDNLDQRCRISSQKYLPQSNRFYFSIVLIMGPFVYMLCTYEIFWDESVNIP